MVTISKLIMLCCNRVYFDSLSKFQAYYDSQKLRPLQAILKYHQQQKRDMAVKTIWAIPKATAMGNWWLAASSQQRGHSCITSPAEFFWQSIKSPRIFSPPTTQIWCPVTSGFSKNLNHLWKGKDFRPSVKFRKIQWGSWWQLGELCEVRSYLLWRKLMGQSLSSVQCFFGIL